MKKILYSLLIFVSLFFVVDKVSALPSGSNLTNKEELATFYVNNGNSWVSLYGNNGTGLECGSISSPDSNAPISCWNNRTLSLATSSLSNASYSLTSFRLTTRTPLKVDNLYRVTINYTLKSTSYSNYAALWKLSSTDYDITTFSSKCDGVNCTIEFVAENLSEGNQNDIWLNLNSNSYTFNNFNNAIAYWYMPIVEETSLSDIFGFKDVSPSVTMVETSSQINTTINSIINNTSPSLNYGQATYDYIYNQFIPNEVFRTYGDYYVCAGSGDAYSSSCYISDSPDVFRLAYGYSGSSSAPSSTYFNLYVEPTEEHKVYRFIIDSGKKVTEGTNVSGYITSSSFAKYLYYNSSSYLPTNVPYFKMQFGYYKTIKTADGYMFNPGDIVLYKDGNEYVVNTDYKTSIIPEPNVFEEEIDDINYSKMIFNFDIETLASRDYVFDGIFDFSTIGFISDSGLDDSFGDGGTFLEPYLEYMLTDGSKGTIKIFNYDDGKLARTVWYGTYQDTVSSDITDLRLIIPMESTVEVRYDINLVSYIPFEVSYELDSTLDEYYEKVDLTNKYGIIFMPKLTINNSYINSPIDIVGIEQILVYDSYDYKTSPIAIYEDVLLYFNYNFSLENINHNLFMKVDGNANPVFVRYDTRYYTYEIVDSKYSVGAVTNPNTVETHYVDYSNTANVSSGFSNISDIFEFISSQLDNQSEAYILFQNSVNAFFNTMPSEFYILILTLFSIILLGVTLGLGGWR